MRAPAVRRRGLGVWHTARPLDPGFPISQHFKHSSGAAAHSPEDQQEDLSPPPFPLLLASFPSCVRHEASFPTWTTDKDARHGGHPASSLTPRGCVPQDGSRVSLPQPRPGASVPLSHNRECRRAGTYIQSQAIRGQQAHEKMLPITHY